MKKCDTSRRNEIQDVLCPFTDWYCTQGANESYSHKGSEANDIRGLRSGIRYPYYAPVDVRCVNINRTYAFVWWQSIEKVRFADGTIDYVTFLCGHDNTLDCYIGQTIKQGAQIGNMGNAGNATGVHCHIEVGRGKQNNWERNLYGIYCIPNQIPLENVFFMNDTNMLLGIADWKYLDDVNVDIPVEENKMYLNLSKEADTWRIYSLGVHPVVKKAKGMLRPSNFGGLSYTILGYEDNGTTAIIDTVQFGRVKIFIQHKFASITDNPIYELINRNRFLIICFLYLVGII